MSIRNRDGSLYFGEDGLAWLRDARTGLSHELSANPHGGAHASARSAKSVRGHAAERSPALATDAWRRAIALDRWAAAFAEMLAHYDSHDPELSKS